MRRPKTDTKSETQEKLKDANIKLKAENRQLRKRLSAAHKQLRKIDSYPSHYDDADDEEGPLDTTLPMKTYTCTNCSRHDITLIELGIYTIYKCNDCGKRRRVKKDLD